MSSISVVLCAYNGEKYLYEQLYSIYNQSKKLDEVIIIDDNSSDSSIMIIEDFIKKYNTINWRLVCNTNNKGFRLNFIEAISQAKGDIIFLSDQDDIWSENKVVEMVSYLDKNKSVMALSSTFEIIDAKGNEINKALSLLNYKENINKNIDVEVLTTEKFYSWGSIIGCAMCFRKDIVKYLVMDLAEYKYFSHDTYINYIASIVGEVHLLNKVLLKYRIHGENTSISNEKSYGLNERVKEIIDHKNFYSRIRSIIEENRIIEIDSLKIDSILSLDEKRLEVFRRKDIFQWIKLSFEINNYNLYTRNILKAIKMYFADLFYMFRG